MSLVAHRFWRVKFRTFVVVFYRQVELKKTLKYSKVDTYKSMSYQGQKLWTISGNFNIRIDSDHKNGKITRYFLTMQTLQLDFNPAWAVFKFSAFELPAAFFNFAAFSLAFAWAWIFCCPRAIIWKMTEICKFGDFWNTSWNIDSLNYFGWTISSRNLTKEACNFNKTTVYLVFKFFCSFWLLYLLVRNFKDFRAR